MFKTPMDTDFFRALAVNHHAVLSVAMTLAENNDARTMSELLPVFANEMKDSKFFKANAHGKVELNGGQGEIPYTFNQAFVQVLRPTIDKNGNLQKNWTSDQEHCFQGMQLIAQRNEAALQDFLLLASEHVEDTRYLQLLNRYDTDITQSMMLKACAGGRMETLHNLAKHTTDGCLAGFAERLLPGCKFPNGDAEGMKGLGRVFEESDDGRNQVVAFMERFKDDETIDVWRQEFFHRQMALFDKKGQTWSMQALAEIAGVQEEAGVIDAVRRWSKAHLDKDLESVIFGLNNGSFAFSKCVQQTLRAHCAPVAEAMGGVFQAVGSRAQSMSWVFQGPMRSVDAYKQTLLVLQANGHDLNGMPTEAPSQGHVQGHVQGQKTIALEIDAIWAGVKKRLSPLDEHGLDLSGTRTDRPETPYTPALKLLSGQPNTPDRDAKLAALLDLGAKPANDIAKGIKNIESRNRWKSVIAAHSARKAAHSLIDEMDLDDAKTPMP